MTVHAGRILIFLIVFVALNPVTLFLFGAWIDLEVESPGAIARFVTTEPGATGALHALVCFLVGTQMWCSARGARWLAVLLGAWLLCFAASYVYVSREASFVFDMSYWSLEDNLALAATLLLAWFLGTALSWYLVAKSEGSGSLHRTLRVPAAIAIVVVVLLGGLHWYGDAYTQARRHHDAGRYTEAAALLESQVVGREWMKAPIPHAAASSSWRDSFVLLGQMYETGQGVVANSDAALRLYMGAAGEMKWWKTHEVNRDTGSWAYVGYGSGTQGAAEACRMVMELSDIALYCKGFEHSVNATKLDDPDLAQIAADKFLAALQHEDPDVQMLRAAAFGRTDLMRDALAAGADPNVIMPDLDIKELHEGVLDMDSWARDSSMTPLWAAAVRHHTEAMGLLLEQGADPNLMPGDAKQKLLSRVVSNAQTTIWMGGYATDAAINHVELVLRVLLHYRYEVTDEDLRSIDFRHEREGIPHDAHNSRLQRLADRCYEIIGT